MTDPFYGLPPALRLVVGRGQIRAGMTEWREVNSKVGQAAPQSHRPLSQHKRLPKEGRHFIRGRLESDSYDDVHAENECKTSACMQRLWRQADRTQHTRRFEYRPDKEDTHTPHERQGHVVIFEVQDRRTRASGKGDRKPKREASSEKCQPL